jgi:RNA polymerase sigma factor (sigma-70 family)
LTPETSHDLASNPRQAKIIEMHFFAGLTFEEIAPQLDVSTRTVKRDWTTARAWLQQKLIVLNPI